MKKVTYSERANFYYEETKTDIDHLFIKSILSDYKIKSALDIPCGAGRNLTLFSYNCEKTLFGDLNSNMVNEVNKRIANLQIKNCHAARMDICKYNLDNQVDATFVMRQGLQLIKPNDLSQALGHIFCSTNKIIVLDLYDFLSKNNIGMFPDYLINPIKEFYFDNNIVKRYTRYEKLSDCIIVYNKYVFDNLIKYSTKYKLFSYNYEYIYSLIKTFNYRKLTIYSNYNFGLYENHNSMIWVIEI